jgi:hypothetical protein
MNYEALKNRYPLTPNHYCQYLNPRTKPPLNTQELATTLLVEDERHRLESFYNGNVSVVLYYHNQEGSFVSFSTENDDLILQQLQGGRSRKAYRVVTGLQTDIFWADQAVAMAQLPNSGVARVAVPALEAIPSIVNSESLETALMRYKSFIVRALLNWSDTDQLYVRDIHGSTSS